MAVDGTESAGEHAVMVGLLADPGLPTEIAQRLSAELPAVLSRRVNNRVDWQLRVVSAGLVLDSHDRVPLVDQAHETMTAEGWDLMICLTDLPRKQGPRPILADVSSTHGVALLSLPAIGWVRRQPHVRDTAVHLIGILAGQVLQLNIDEGRRDDHHHIRSRPTERVSPVRQVVSGHRDIDVQLALSGFRGRVRLLFGMVRDNRPWRLVPSLSKAFAAAVATAAFGVFYFSTWRMADSLSPGRLLGISAFAIAVMVGWLIAYNNLWERPYRHEERHMAVFYNVATVLTLALGVSAMYLLLFTVMLLTAVAVISAEYLRFRLGHPAAATDYVGLVWLASSMGILAGALGASLETEETVQQATYSKREQERRARARQRREHEQQHQRGTDTE